MRVRERRRGQATVELVGVVLATAVLVTATGAALVRTGAAASIAGAAARALGGGPGSAGGGLSPDVAALLARAARGGPGDPGPLAARAAIAAERGAAAADRIVRGTLVAAFAARYGDLGRPLEIRPYPAGAAPEIPRGLRYVLAPSGPLVVPRIATAADEARAAAAGPPGGLGAAASSLVGNLVGVPAGAIEGVEGRLAALLESSYASAAVSAGTGLATVQLRSPRTLPAPGDRAGDVVVCRPLVLLQRDDRGVRRTPADYALRIVVVRDGRPFAPELVPGAMRCSELATRR